MPAADHAIGIDLGTTGLKVALFDEAGRRAAAATRPIATERGEGGVAEQDAEAIWAALCACVRQVVADAGLGGERVASIGCTSQYSSLVAVDARARPLAPMLLWLDRRGGEHSRAIRRRHPEAKPRFREVHGIAPIGHGGDVLSHLLHVQHDRPEVHARVAAYLEPVDYLTARLTGRLTATDSSMFMSLLTDNRRRGVADYDAELLAMAGVDRDKLPALVSPEAPLGPLRDDAAAELGLGAGTQVIAGLNDTQALALCTGSLSGARGGISVGTTSILVTHVAGKDADLHSAILAMPGPLSDGYVVMAENGLGGKVIEHFLTRFVHADDSLGAHATADPFAGLEQALERTPPGGGGVLFLPFLDGSLAPRPNPGMRGAFLNLSLDTDREALARAVVEGVAHNLRSLLSPVERLAGHALVELTFSGGGARSAGLGRILADVLDRPLRRLADPVYANCRAMALLSLHRLGRIELSQVSSAGAASTVHEPHPEHRARYDHMHGQFVAAFEHNAPIFDTLNR